MSPAVSSPACIEHSALALAALQSEGSLLYSPARKALESSLVSESLAEQVDLKTQRKSEEVREEVAGAVWYVAWRTAPAP